MRNSVWSGKVSRWCAISLRDGRKRAGWETTFMPTIPLHVSASQFTLESYRFDRKPFVDQCILDASRIAGHTYHN
jgi:hypothetical protein